MEENNLTRRQILARRAEEMRRNMTACEKKLWYDYLAEHEFSFRPQKVIGNYIVDFYCRKVRVSIEVDGDSHYNPQSVEYDRCRTTFLSTREILELRFTNTEIRENFEGVCEVIEATVNARRNDVDHSNFAELRRKCFT